MPATIADIERHLHQYLPSADVSALEDAYEFARHAHEGQARKSG